MPGVEFTAGIEQVGVAALVRQRAGGQRRDELLRGPGQHAADVNMAFPEPPDQVERLVGSDTAADDQRDAGLVGGWLCPGAGEETPTGLGADRGAAALSSLADCPSTSRRMIRTSSSTEWPLRAERSRKSAFSNSSAFGWSGWPWITLGSTGDSNDIIAVTATQS